MACQSILIVEDSAEIRLPLQQFLEDEGYSVTVAVNGKEGLALLKTMGVPCLVLLDLMMPVMTGYEFLESKAKDNIVAQIPVAIISAAADRGQVEGMNVQAFIKKPIDLGALLKVIEKHCTHLN